MFESPPLWMYLVGFLLVLGPLITVHELGHYLVGRWFGVEAKAFSIGFGSELFGWTDKRGTRWRLAALPLGGYVQFKGDMNPASVPGGVGEEEPEPGSFQSATLWKRALIVAAGPVTNILVAIAIFFAFNVIYGKPMPVDPSETGVIASFSEESAARDAGFEVGDRIITIDGEEVENWLQVQRSIQIYPSRTFDFTLVRNDQELDISVTSRPIEVEDGFGNKSTIGVIGVMPKDATVQFEPLTITQSAVRSVTQCVDIFDMIITGIGQIISGERSISELGGPIKIAKFSGERLSLGLTEFVFFCALISLNLAFINLLPIPALDGGHLAFYAAEAIRRKPVGPQATEWAYRVGIVLVLMFMGFAIVNDFITIPFF